MEQNRTKDYKFISKETNPSPHEIVQLSQPKQRLHFVTTKVRTQSLTYKKARKKYMKKRHKNLNTFKYMYN